MMNQRAGLRHEVHRDTLYAQVWAEPMVKLATRYGVSDVALAKVCRKMEIPVPPRGYWRRIQTGRRLVPSPLPKLRPGIRSTVTITAQPGQDGPIERSPVIVAQEAFEHEARNRIQVHRRSPPSHP